MHYICFLVPSTDLVSLYLAFSRTGSRSTRSSSSRSTTSSAGEASATTTLTPTTPTPSFPLVTPPSPPALLAPWEPCSVSSFELARVLDTCPDCLSTLFDRYGPGVVRRYPRPTYRKPHLRRRHWLRAFWRFLGHVRSSFPLPAHCPPAHISPPPPPFLSFFHSVYPGLRYLELKYVGR